MGKFRKFIAIGVIVGLFGVSVARPRVVYADTGKAVVLGVAGFVAYVFFLFGLTKLVYGSAPSTTAAQDPLQQYDDEGKSVRFVESCRQEGANVTMACW